MGTKEIKNRLKWLWYNGYANGIQADTEKICTIEILEYRSLIGLNTGVFYGKITFDRWYNSSIFHTVVKGRYTPNELGIEVNIKNCSGGGSSGLEFNPDKKDKVIEALNKAGYKIAVLS